MPAYGTQSHATTVEESSVRLSLAREPSSVDAPSLVPPSDTNRRRYLTSVENRLARVENLFAELLPKCDIDEALAARTKEHRKGDTPEPAASQASPLRPTTPGGTRSAISEAVPEESDGFDWQEDIDVLADGMAALSVEPRGAGYLGIVSLSLAFIRS